MLKRYNAALLMLFMALMLVLSACGQPTSNAADTSSTTETKEQAAVENTAEETPVEPAAEKTAATESDTVTFASDAGDVQVPRNPQRIVDLTAFTTGYLVALDAPVAGALSGAINNKYIKEQLAAQGTVDLGDLPTAEPILELKPDLIIAYKGTEGIDQLSAIAPVVQLEYGKRTYKDLLLELGKLTDREDQAKAWIENWESQINELKPRVEAAVGDRTVSILNPYDKGLYVFGHNYGRGGEILYGEFGLKAP